MSVSHATGAPSAAPGVVVRVSWLARLALSEFRCYRRAELEVDARPVVLTGPNGAGKTNLLEAISFLAPGRGLRGARLIEVQRQAAAAQAAPAPGAGWAVAASVVTPEGRRDLGTGRDAAADAQGAMRERRLVKVDGAFVRSQQALGEVLAVTWLTPQMDGLFRDAASGRRRFLDRLVYAFDPAHAGRVNAYEQSLRERARLLRAERADDGWLAALEDSLARHGVAIAAARRDLVARLNRACALRVGPFPVAGLELAGDVEGWLETGTALDAEDALRARLGAVRAQDAEAGGAGLGPHRSDLVVRHLDRGLPADMCSTGEQKALLIAIVLAHARLLGLDHGAAPLLLLDEVAAHLDEARRTALYDEILALQAQAWLTGTDAAIFGALGAAAQFVEVREATLRPGAVPAGPVAAGSRA